jgi:hypothetical protein
MRFPTLAILGSAMCMASGANAQSVPSTPAAPTQATIPAFEPTGTALAKAGQLLTLIEARRQFDAVIAQSSQVARLVMEEEYDATEEGRAELALIDARFPGGRDAFLDRFAAVLVGKFEAAYTQFLERNTSLHARYISETDLDTLVAVMSRLRGVGLSEEEVSREREVFRSTPTAARFFAAVPVIQQEMADFGRTIGQRLGLEAYEQVVAEHPSVFGEQS